MRCCTSGDVDRRDLGDRRHATGIAGSDEVAGVDRAQADAAGHRRDDARPLQVQPRAVFVGTIHRRRTDQLLRQGRLRVDGLAGDRVLLEQHLVAVQLLACGVELRRVAHARADRLVQRGLERLRVDRRQHLALLHELAFLVQHLRDHPRDLRRHDDTRRRGDGTEGFDDHRYIGVARRRDTDGARRTAAAARHRADGAGRARRRGARETAGSGRRPVREIPGQRADRDERKQRDRRAEPAAGRRDRGGRRSGRSRGQGGGRLVHAQRLECARCPGPCTRRRLGSPARHPGHRPSRCTGQTRC
jgi:hypothetical protein